MNFLRTDGELFMNIHEQFTLVHEIMKRVSPGMPAAQSWDVQKFNYDEIRSNFARILMVSMKYDQIFKQSWSFR